MSAINFLKHLFIPHESNNQKAKIIHSESLFIFVIGIIGFQFILNFTHGLTPSVLGYAANIAPSEVIRLTNEQRVANGLSPVTENATLSSAALAKGQDMLNKGYWAHFAPDGTSPWSFFTGFGYKYQYAGENLARDFSDSKSAVTAWMNSPTHKENILNPHYKEIGIGVVQGSLAGADTTVIVQFFGTSLSGAPSIPVAKAADTEIALTREPVIEPVTTQIPAMATAQKPRFSPFGVSKNLSLGVVGLVLLVLGIDLIVVKHKRITRISGRTLAHIAYLSMILAVILILKAGQII